MADIDGDGVADLLRGASKSGADGSLMLSAVGRRAGDEYGSAVAAVGDLDRDGVPDLVVGAHRSAAQAGAIFALSGSGGHVLAHASGVTPGAALGAAVDALPDLDGDGFPEFLAAHPGGPMIAGGVEVRRAAAAVPFAASASPVESLVLSFTPAPPGGVRTSPGFVLAFLH